MSFPRNGSVNELLIAKKRFTLNSLGWAAQLSLEVLRDMNRIIAGPLRRSCEKWALIHSLARLSRYALDLFRRSGGMVVRLARVFYKKDLPLPNIRVV